MLAAFRKFGATKASKGMLLVLVVCFGAWGIGDYLTNNIGLDGLSVNGKGVSLSMLEANYNRQKQSAAQIFGKEPTQEQLVAYGIPQNVVAEAVNRTVLQQAAGELQLVPAPAALRAEIANIPAFQRNGAFDLASYRQALRGIGLSTGQFEEQLAGDLSVRSLGTLVGLVTPQSASMRSFYSIENATLGLETFTIPATAVANLPAPDAAGVKAFYEQNQQAYTLPEKRSVEVLRLNLDEVAKNITLPESQIEQFYNDHKDSYAKPETRKVRHVLYKTQEEAVEAVGRIHSLDDFIKVAGAEGIDTAAQTNGGDLGYIAKADVVPGFANVAFNLPVGKLSAPSATEFGWHLIWVENIKKPEAPNFAEVKDRVKADALRPEAEEAIQSLLNRIADALAGGETLAKVAEKEGLKLQRITTVAADSDALPADIRQAAFATPQGEVSEPVDTPNGGIAYVAVTAVNPGNVPPLEAIQAQVAKDAAAAARASALRAMAEGMVGAARAPGAGSLAATAAAKGVQGTPAALSITKLQDVPQWLAPQWTNVQSLPAGGVLAGPVQNGQDMVLVRLDSRKLATEADPAQLKDAAAEYRGRVQADTEALLISTLVSQAKVKFNTARLKQLFGPSYEPTAGLVR